MKTVKGEMNGNTRLNLGTLEKWLSDTSTVPDDETQPFILDFVIDDMNEAKPRFKCFVTSRILLKSAVGADKVHCDATYKIVREGYPILVVGTSDLYKRVSPVRGGRLYKRNDVGFCIRFYGIANCVEKHFQ